MTEQNRNAEKLVTVPDTDVTVRIDPDGYIFGREVLELVRFIPQKKYQRAADLGSGDGVIPLLAARERTIREIWGVEISAECCRRAEKSVVSNNLAGIIQIHHGDIRKLRGVFQKYAFDLITANPPFFQENTDHQTLSDGERRSRQEITADLDCFVQAAAYLLKKRGDLVMLHHPSRLETLFHALHRAAITVKEMQFLHHRDGRALFVLVRAVPGGKPGLICRPPVILPESFKNQFMES